MLEEAKQNQNEFKPDLNEIKKEDISLKSKEEHCTTLKCFTKQEKVLLNFWMIILQLYQSLNLKQLTGKESNY